MADIASLAVSGVALASLFTACVDCFEYLQLTREFGRDYQSSLLRLNLVQLRLSRWGESVRIAEVESCTEVKSRRDYQVALMSDREVESVRRTLGLIMLAFEDAERISRRLDQSGPGRTEQQLVVAADGNDNDLKELLDRVRDSATQRQQRTSILRRTAWALYEQKHFKRLLEEVTGLVNDLVELFPAAKPTQERLCNQEITRILADSQKQRKRQLEILENVSASLDSTMARVAANNLAGHSYRNIQANDNARMMNGDEISIGWQGSASGQSHTYDGVSASGQSMIMNGNRFGGPSFFA